MIKKALLAALILIAFIAVIASALAADLDCSIIDSGSCAYTKVLYLQNETGGYDNAHAQNVSVAAYNYSVCCNATGDDVTAACPTVFLKLSNATNAHVQVPSWAAYPVDACIGTVNGSVTCTNRTTDCLGNETCIVSIASGEGDNTTNAHVASCGHYLTNICCSLDIQPSADAPVITPDPAYTDDDLNCTFTVTDPDSASLYANYTWFRNNTAFLSGQVAVANNTQKVIQLLAGNTTKHDSWICRITPYDSDIYGVAKNSSAVEILNTPPCKVNLTQPENESHTTNRTPAFNWSACPADPDNDSITYILNMTCSNSAGGSCSPLDDKLISGIAENSHALPDSDFLKNFWDTQEYYNWTVQAYDDEEYGAVSDEWRLYLDALVALAPINDSVNFGTKNPDDTDDTADNDPYPLSYYNNGNCFINVSLNGTALFYSAAFPSSNYQFKTGSLESNSFNWTESITSWTNVSDSALAAIAELNWSDSGDTYETDIAIAIASSEPPGSRSSTLNFTGIFTDVEE
jgi:hypothetical protein